MGKGEWTWHIEVVVRRNKSQKGIAIKLAYG